MNIVTFGSRFYGGQIDRIDAGLSELGHDISVLNGPELELIYSNDATGFSKAIELWKSLGQKPKLIFNVLDVPYWVREWPQIQIEWANLLKIPNRVTCISDTVRLDIKKYFNIDAQVIYNPIKPVYIVPNLKRDIFSLFVGRALSPNKRVMSLVLPLYIELSKFFGDDCVHFAGSEPTGFGIYHGIVSDEELNMLYNRSVFTLIPSKQEGLNLPLIESLCAGSIPIVCNDMSTASEFAPPEFQCDPTPMAMYNKMRELSQDLDKCHNICGEFARAYSYIFSPKKVAQNILEVYNSL